MTPRGSTVTDTQLEEMRVWLAGGQKQQPSDSHYVEYLLAAVIELQERRRILVSGAESEQVEIKAEAVYGAGGFRESIERMQTDGWQFVDMLGSDEPFTELTGYRCVLWRRRHEVVRRGVVLSPEEAEAARLLLEKVPETGFSLAAELARRLEALQQKHRVAEAREER